MTSHEIYLYFISIIILAVVLGANDSIRKLYQIYPGPLIRGITHKKTIIEFCEDQIRLGPLMSTLKSRSNSMSSLYSLGQANKSSYTLMWNLLILLLRQNGVSNIFIHCQVECCIFCFFGKINVDSKLKACILMP